MATKKKFGLSASLAQGLSDTVSMARANSGRYLSLPVRMIETDPNNPRELCVTEADIIQGLNQDDPQYKQKKHEFDTILKELGETIKVQGVIQPILVYKHADKYRIIAGECRFLGTLIAKKNEIPARIFDEKPSEYEIRRLQWIENNARNDLSLKDKISNVKQLINALNIDHDKLTAEKLASMLSVSPTQARRYLLAINAPMDVVEAINNGYIENLKLVESLARIDDEKSRKKMLESYKSGKTIEEITNAAKAISKKKSPKSASGRGRKATKINLGNTKNPKVAEKIIEAVVRHVPELSSNNSNLTQIDWLNMGEVNKAFQEILKKLEKIVK